MKKYNIICPQPNCHEESILLLTETCATYICRQCGTWSHKIVKLKKPVPLWKKIIDMLWEIIT